MTKNSELMQSLDEYEIDSEQSIASQEQTLPLKTREETLLWEFMETIQLKGPQRQK